MRASESFSPPCEGGVRGGGQGITNMLGQAGNSAESIPHAGTCNPFVVNGVRPVGCTHPTMTPSWPCEV